MSERNRLLTAAEIETYRRDGVVCLRGALCEQLSRWSEVPSTRPGPTGGSLHFAGDDATVLHRPSAPAEFPIDPDLQAGDPLDSTTYPVVWPRPV